MKKYFTYLLYISIVFLGVYLYKLDFFIVPVIHSFSYIAISIVMLLLGFICQVINWQQVLSVFGLRISFKDSFKSTGLSMFMKYVPGKLMAVMGRATYISEQYKCSIKLTTTGSAITQVITLVTGAIIGLCFLIIEGKETESSWIFGVFILSLILGFCIFGYNIFRRAIYIIAKKFKKRILLPRINILSIVNIVPLFILRWFFWSFGFYFLLKGFVLEVPISTAFAFPLASVLGIVAVFSPGGIGVREGVLITCLVIVGLKLDEVSSVVVVSRLWFLIGECLVFLLALILKSIKR